MNKNEILTTGNEDQFSTLMAEYGQDSTFDTGVEADLQTSAIVPTLSMARDVSKLSVKIGSGDHVQELMSENEIVVAFISVRTARTLWLPQSQRDSYDYNRPICSTGWIDPRSANSAAGSFQTLEGLWHPGTTPPTCDETGRGPQVSLKCNACPWSAFGSQGKWEESESGAPACGESRVYIAIPLIHAQTIQRGGKSMNLYTWDKSHAGPLNPLGCMKMSLNMASNRNAIREIAMGARTTNMPLPAIAYSLSTRLESASAGVRYPVLQPRPAGVVLPNDFQEWKTSKQWLDDFIDGNAVSHALPEEEIPF